MRTRNAKSASSSPNSGRVRAVAPICLLLRCRSTRHRRQQGACDRLRAHRLGSFAWRHRRTTDPTKFEPPHQPLLIRGSPRCSPPRLPFSPLPLLEAAWCASVHAASGADEPQAGKRTARPSPCTVGSRASACRPRGQERPFLQVKNCCTRSRHWHSSERVIDQRALPQGQCHEHHLPTSAM